MDIRSRTGRSCVATFVFFASTTLAACGGAPAPAPTAPEPMAAATPAEPAKPAEDAWRKQSLELRVSGFMFNGALKPAPASWAGSGAWIGPNMAVTNAHVALRALQIEAKDDLGNVYNFNEILAVDEQADLAIIKATPGSDAPLNILPRPADPKSLRGTKVRVIGNTGGLGLSYYDGRVTNVVGDADQAVLLHDANTAGGSSGGPLISVDSGKLVGINHSSLPSLNAKAAAPSWVVDNLKTQASSNKALAFTDAFSPADLPVSWYVERAVCLKPGEIFKGVFASVATNDMVADIAPAQAGQVLGFILLSGNTKLAEAVLTGRTQGAWTLKSKGQYVYALLNPKTAAAPACATVKFGRVEWAARLRN